MSGIIPTGGGRSSTAVSYRPKRGRAVGKTKQGKGTKQMPTADGNGLPIGYQSAGVDHHEVKPAVAALQTVRVPRRGGGRPKQRSEEPVADKAYDEG
jgi:hypothetical protein